MSPDHTNPTQVSFGNFPNNVQARELADFLEEEVGLVLRCKMKKVSGNMPPHAFVHFVSPKVAKEAVNIAEKGRLIFRREWHLKARMDDRAWLDGRRGFNSKVYSNIQLVDVIVELGSITGPKSMLVSWRGPDRGPIFRLEPAGKRLRFFFTQYLPLNQDPRQKTRCDVMMEVHLQEVKEVREVEREVDPVLLLQLSSPPWIFYRTAEDDIYEYHSDPSQLADDEDPWIRCLDIVTPDRSIGRCLDYRLTVSPRQKTAFMKVVSYFRNHNILKKSIQAAFSLSIEDKATISRAGHFYTVPHQKEIELDVMLLVNSLVHQGIVPASNLSSSFYKLLQPTVTPSSVAIIALRHMLTYRNPVFEATQVLQSVIRWATNEINLVKDGTLVKEITTVGEPKLPIKNIVVRRLIITPTRALCLPPEVELSNRVLRHFSRVSDRFLRVSFLDENGLSIPAGSLSVQVAPIVREVSSNCKYNRTDVYNRILSIMKEGFSLCGREYHFLAFSAGQLRESSAWFFASDGYIAVNKIREWMGTFPEGNVAKHAARMGQCFSATVSTIKVRKLEVFRLKDVTRNGYDFSDGCGKISPVFAQQVAKILKLDENPPSAYQIRYAGYKGVVGVWSIEARSDSGHSYKLALRDSMKKFDSNHCLLEIVGWSKFLPCFLNRQIITLLSALQVNDTVFIKLQETMIWKLNRMVVDRDLAYSVLTVTCSGELYTTALRMLIAGFDPLKEAHLKAMLVAIRAGQLEELVQKTRIFVPKGRWLLGCLDETASLEYGQCFLRVTDPQEQSGRVVITGTVIMTKNPCMHPGDIRVLQAVDIPALHHMADCLVVPQNGARPHPNEASGSDLDGDVYFVSWDENLLPPSRQSLDPMEYISEAGKDSRGPVKIEHVIEFFAKHMVNDSLGKICNAHVVIADKSPKGALDEACLYLADLAAKAVDYPKTGKPAVMPYDLKPQTYPDFMEKGEGITYKSNKIIGRLFRLVQQVLSTEDEALQLEGGSTKYQIPEPTYDRDLEVDGFETYLEKAWDTKQAYDQRLQAIMSQFNVTNEAEVVTGHVRVGVKIPSRRVGDVKERVKFAFTTLHKEFSRLLSPYKEEVQEQDNESFSIIPDEILKAQASAWYHVTYHPDWYRRPNEGINIDVYQRPLLSFPWLAIDHLAAIKSKKLKLRSS